MTTGCAKFVALPLPPIGAPEIQDAATSNCSWVRVTGDGRAFDVELFLCCPGTSKPAPVCRRAEWVDAGPDSNDE
ncbi:hypothetical protein LBMAG42_36890 [Deltaproteobacteria bacterium]|nr:hypothetical protein LBMAG42_36890 [Deltaproteobacteria bacterium]